MLSWELQNALTPIAATAPFRTQDTRLMHYPHVKHDSLCPSIVGWQARAASASRDGAMQGVKQRALMDHVGLLVDGGGGVDGVDVDMCAGRGAQSAPPAPSNPKPFLNA